MLDNRLLRDDLSVAATWRAADSCSTSRACARWKSGARPRRSRPTGCAPSAMRTARTRRAGQGQGRGRRGAAGAGRGAGAQARGRRSDLDEVQAELDELQLGLPNLLQASVPDGRDENANVELRRWGTPRAFDFTPRDHVELGERLAMMDFEAAGRIAGARFVVLRGASRACIARWASSCSTCTPRSTATREVYVPYLVVAGSADRHRPAAEVRAGPVRGAQRAELLPDPTAEVPVTNLVRDQILEAHDAAAEDSSRTRRAFAPRLARPARTRAA